MQDLLVRSVDTPAASAKRVVDIEAPAVQPDIRAVVPAQTEFGYSFKYGK
jgi:hypothetical protein